MNDARRDRELGMDRPITRRDFLNGVRIALAGSLVASSPAARRLAAAAEGEAVYPPALTGLRGSHDGSWEVAHALRDGAAWTAPETPAEPVYDLVVVGAGISGLAAAYFYQKAAGGRARILLLDNHDDFGGHAKRNEFRAGRRLLIGYGGTQSIDTPSRYSPVARGLLEELGIRLERFYEAFDRDLYASLGLGRGIFLDAETFGADRLVAGTDRLAPRELAARLPLREAARRDLVRLHESTEDPLAGLSVEEKVERLARTSYRDFLRDLWKVDEQVLALYATRTHGLFGTGIEAVPALDCWALGYPGFSGMRLPRRPYRRLGRTARLQLTPEPYIYHFPDGNASVARLLVRALVPGAIPGDDMEDLVTARADYETLDRDGASVRVRLRSTVVAVRHRGPADAAREVDVVYVRDGAAARVRARAVVLACWHQMIPYLCPELPAEQKKALADAVKVPLVYTNVLLRNWSSFRRLGVDAVHCPNGYYYSFSLDFPVSLGDYRHPRSPEEPILVHMTRTPCRPGLPAREQHVAGRYELLGTSFESFERATREQLGRVLGSGGFDPARDILAITVNRWPHGYAYEYNALFDPDWPEGEEPCARARRPFGRIAIANSDAAAYAYTDAAIDEAYRAVVELLRGGPPS